MQPMTDKMPLERRRFDVRLAVRRRPTNNCASKFIQHRPLQPIILLIYLCVMLLLIHCVHAETLKPNRVRITRRTTPSALITPTSATTSNDAMHPNVSSTTRPDLLCNVDTPYQCICNRSLGDLDHRFFACDNFLESQHIMAVSLVMRNVNLSAQLHTTEPYQQYFRRRVADIISQDCEAHANKCPGLMLKMDRDQIVILHVDYLPRQRTEAQFVALLQPAHSNRITLEHILSSDVVKNILSAQLRPLARVLGGVHIERLQLASVERRPTQSQNHRLYMLLLCAGIGLLFCYTIACFKVIRDVIKKRRSRSPTILAEGATPNYGTCADSLLAKCDAPNGKLKATANRSSNASNEVLIDADSASKSRRKSSGGPKGAGSRRSTRLSATLFNFDRQARSPTVAGDSNSVALDVLRTTDGSGVVSLSNEEAAISTPHSGSGNFDTRSFQRMFACDLSQLPAESFSAESTGDDVSNLQHASISPLSQLPDADGTNAEILHTAYNPSSSPTRYAQPPPIVIASSSHSNLQSRYTSAPSTEREQKAPPQNIPQTSYMRWDSNDSIPLDTSAFNSTRPAPEESSSGLAAPVFARPLSRRGSRDSPIEQGKEEFSDDFGGDDFDERPLGDSGIVLGKEAERTQLAAPNDDELRSTSDSDDDESSAHVYHALAERANGDEDDHSEPSSVETALQVKSGARSERTPTQSSIESPVGIDNASSRRRQMSERGGYQRLQESPAPTSSAAITPEPSDFALQVGNSDNATEHRRSSKGAHESAHQSTINEDLR